MSGRTPVGREIGEGRVEVGADEPRLGGDVVRDLLEALGCGRIAIDRDQRAGGADPLGQQPRVAAASERAVDDRLARSGIGLADHFRGKDWDVLGRHVGQGHHSHYVPSRPRRRLQCRGDALGQLRRQLLVLLVLDEPVLRRPDLEPRPHPGDDASPLETGVFDELPAEPDAAGRVQVGRLGMGEEAALDPARVAAHRIEVSKCPLLVLLGGLGRPDLHAALDALHQDDPLRERGAVSGAGP